MKNSIIGIMIALLTAATLQAAQPTPQLGIPKFTPKQAEQVVQQAVPQLGIPTQAQVATATSLAQQAQAVIPQTTTLTSNAIATLIVRVQESLKKLIASANAMAAQPSPSAIALQSFNVAEEALNIPAALIPLLNNMTQIISLIGKELIAPFDGNAAQQTVNVANTIAAVVKTVQDVDTKLQDLIKKLRQPSTAIAAEIDAMIAAIKAVKL